MVYSGGSNSLPTTLPTDMITDDSDVRDKEKATEHVANLLGDDLDRRDLFCQMDVLREYRDDLVWKEMARWVRYEEAVEEGGKRWSKPHVSSMAMEALQDLQNLLSTCPVLLDLEANQMSDIVDDVLNSWIQQKVVPSILKNHFRSVLLKQHKHQHNKTKSAKTQKKTITNFHKLHKSSPNLTTYKKDHEGYINGSFEPPSENGLVTVTPFTETCPDSPSLAFCPKMNSRFIKKIPPGAEVANLLVGEIEELKSTVAAFVRLEKAKNVGDITEVKLNTRFIFILLGPKGHLGECAEITRCMASLFTDEIFRCVAYKARNRKDILAGVQEFSRYLTVLPPGSWDPTTRIEPPETLPSQEFRKSVPTTLSTSKSMVSLRSSSVDTLDSHASDETSHADPALVRTGRLFGGLIQDVKRKVPWYLSDFKDAFHVQSIASFCFLFLATLTPNVTFGGLLGQATEQYMGTMECILSAAICGVIFALFAGQPLNILGSTGPMLVLELILFTFCKDHDLDFMPFRVWVGLWTALFLLIVVAFDLSALVRYITRFTEDSFACLIALIFIYQAFLKTFEIASTAPVHTYPVPGTDSFCFCAFPNTSVTDSYQNETHTTTLPLIMSLNIKFPVNLTLKFPIDLIETAKNNSMNVSDVLQQCTANGGVLLGSGCDSSPYVPDVFFFSLILFVGTFTLSVVLVKFRNSLFFPTWVRQNVSDFAVLISIIVMVLIDAFIGIPTPKLTVPAEFKPTRPGRPWIISPLSDKNPWWLIILSVLPAILATILIFMDQQITAVIVNRKENKLQKGAGYHLDMLVLSVLIVVLSILGLPWYVAATVSALAHVMSLKKESECTAPGEKPMFLGVREQRVTSLMVGVFSGLAVFITSVLQYIPMPVLYGVFLYMGVAPLGSMQLVQRLLLMFMPAKYQPDYDYLRHVPICRVHLFTAIQVLCLAVLWIVKSVKSISIAFPVMVVIICFVRKGLDRVFTQRELRWLDDILPSKSMSRSRKGSEDSDDSDIKMWPLDAEKGLDIFGKIKKTPRRCLSDPGEIDEDCKPRNMKLGPRYSLPFLCKTDLDLIKEMNGEQFQDRRTSLLMMNERNRARHSMVEGYGGEKSERKISTNSLNEGKQYRRKMAQHKTDDINQVSRMTSLPVPASGVSDNCHNVSSNIKSPDTRKLKGISTSHVL